MMKAKAKTIKRKKDPNKYPKGWNAKRVKELIHYYDHQTDEEAVAEAEAAYNTPGYTMMQVPVALVPEVRKLIARKAG
jgi:hypothetical protein